jgi:hypothetical protein
MRIFVEASLVCLLLAALALGCESGAERSASFAMKQEIPLGIIDVTIMGWEEVGQIHGLDEYAEMDQRRFVELFLGHRLTLIDSEGYEAPGFHAMPKALYHSLEVRGFAPRDWAVIFHVWIDSQGYVLRVRHPDPGEEDFHVAVVPLD